MDKDDITEKERQEFRIFRGSRKSSYLANQKNILCPTCGAKNLANDCICTSCGSNLEKKQEKRSCEQKKKTKKTFRLCKNNHKVREYHLTHCPKCGVEM